jgi:hypothetical protein
VSARTCDFIRIRALERENHELKVKLEAIAKKQQDMFNAMTEYIENMSTQFSRRSWR